MLTASVGLAQARPNYVSFIIIEKDIMTPYTLLQYIVHCTCCTEVVKAEEKRGIKVNHTCKR